MLGFAIALAVVAIPLPDDADDNVAIAISDDEFAACHALASASADSPHHCWKPHHACQASGLERHPCKSPCQGLAMACASVQGLAIQLIATPTEWCRSSVLSLQSVKWRTLYCPVFDSDAATIAAHVSAL
jgi:hypothetical protein